MFVEEEDVFIWDDQNIEHIGRHNVCPEEAEEAFWDDYRLPFNAHSGHRGIIGATDEGRRLIVIFVNKEVNRIRVITARDASNDEKRYYNKENLPIGKPFKGVDRGLVALMWIR